MYHVSLNNSWGDYFKIFSLQKEWLFEGRRLSGVIISNIAPRNKGKSQMHERR